MDFPDEEEEFEMMYEKEMEDLNDFDLMPEEEQFGRGSKSKRSLDFTSPPLKTAVATDGTGVDTNAVQTPIPVSQRNSSPERNKGEVDKDKDVQNIESRFDQVTAQYDASKRKFNELFGDITDMDCDDDDSDLQSKKQKTDSDEDLIQRILGQRKLNDNHVKANRTNGNSKLCGVSDFTYKSNITSHVPRWPFIPVTLGDGQRRYLRLRSDEFVDKEVRDISVKGKTMGLLAIPYDITRRQAERIIQCKLDNEEEAVNADMDVQLVPSSDGMKESAQLWVEKYKPKSYVDLLSDESTNRTILHWLKLWDKIVFNREKKVRQKPKSTKVEKSSFNQKFNRFSKKIGPDSQEEVDNNGFPHLKMALLCGPPGLGKTTLAHLIALHAGYNVVEVNASDERSPEAFLTALQTATQMRAVLGEKKPNCLVLDEIDGAPAASIELLVKFATGKDVGKARGKKKGSTGALKRPIICICNDVYVPALRPLRQLALVVHFPPTVCTRLALRLLDIARVQHIKTDLGVLLALAEKSNNDIRSCVSVLHFFKTKGKERAEMKMNDVLRSNIGQKDVQKGLFQVWQEIFQIPRSRNRGSSVDSKLQPMPDLDSPDVKFDEVSLATRMQKVLRTVQSCGDYDRLTQGVFENYPRMNIKDSYLDGVVDSLEWLFLSDVMNRSIYGQQNFTLMAYLPYAFVSYHFNFSSLAWPKLNYPSAGYENTQKEQRGQLVLKELLRGMTAAVRVNTHASQLLMDTLPLLLDILVPNLRPVSTQLYSSQEKADLQHVINIMIDFNLSYVQERTQEGSYEYRLDPNVEELVHFPTSKPRSLSYAGKQLLAQEIELEKMRRVEARVAPAPAVVATPVVPSHLQTLTPKPMASKLAPSVMKDFFGRLVPCSQVGGDVQPADEIVKSDVWFHFKEGFSNAVRRNVKIQDLI